MATTPSATTGANIRAEMARRGVSQVALAERLGFSQTALSMRLRGRTPFDINELMAVADALGTSLDALLANVGPADRETA